MEEKTLLDQLVETQFETAFLEVLVPVTSKHVRICLDNLEIDYDSLGDEKEKKLKAIGHIYGLLQTTISDLELVLIFLRIEDRKGINQAFPKLESQEQYFKYHLENFIIRIITITDIVGKLGNAIYETGLSKERCSGYTFRDKIKSIEPTCANIIEELLISTTELKDKRHRKLNTGESKIGYLDGIVFWGEISKIIKSDANTILEELTDRNIKAEINSLEKDLRHIIDLVVKFTDYTTDKFKELANK